MRSLLISFVCFSFLVIAGCGADYDEYIEYANTVSSGSGTVDSDSTSTGISELANTNWYNCSPDVSSDSIIRGMTLEFSDTQVSYVIANHEETDCSDPAGAARFVFDYTTGNDFTTTSGVTATELFLNGTGDNNFFTIFFFQNNDLFLAEKGLLAWIVTTPPNTEETRDATLNFDEGFELVNE